MKELTYWQYGPPDSDDEWVGRRLKNAFGAEETVQMQIKHWKYFDWLAEQGSDMEQWVMDADMTRHNDQYTMDLSGQLLLSLFHSEKRRYLSGKPCPLFINPEGHKPYPDEKAKALPPELVVRELTNAKGEVVSVELPKSYWRYFDWLGQQGVDMNKWVSDADLSRNKGDLEFSLNSELRLNLRQDERNRFVKDQPCPLYIQPDGYDL